MPIAPSTYYDRLKTPVSAAELADAYATNALVDRAWTTPSRPDQWWVADFERHEAPWIRVEVRDLHRRVVAAARLKLRAV
jgi:hypothetical protein